MRRRTALTARIMVAIAAGVFILAWTDQTPTANTYDGEGHCRAIMPCRP